MDRLLTDQLGGTPEKWRGCDDSRSFAGWNFFDDCVLLESYPSKVNL